MSCGKLHEADGGLHLHAPGELHHEDVPEDDAPAGEPGTTEAAPKPPGWVQRAFSLTGTAAAGAWHQHGYLVKPFAAIPAMECSELVISRAFSAPLPALAAAGVVTVLGEGVTEVVNWRGHAVRPVRARTRAAVAAGGAMAAIGGAGAFNEWTALATLIVGALAAGRIAYEEHKAHGSRPRPPAVVAGGEPPAITAGPDPRLLQFTNRFCAPGMELDGVTALAFRETGNGFMFELDFTRARHSQADVSALLTPVAKLYDITRDCIEVSYVPGSESENSCQVVIRKIPVLGTGERAKPKVRPWDGTSTWNPETGTADLGWFTDGTVTHYQFHQPGSGALMGQVAGAIGAGKTGTINVLGAEAGQAVLCSRCGRAGNAYSPGLCPGGCDMHRVMAVWMGDPQEQGLSVWKGRADLTGWGLEGCIELLEFADQVSAERGRYLSSRQWSDRDPVTGRGRVHTGQGHCDTEIGLPLIFLVMDEFPMLVRRDLNLDDELRARVLTVAINAVTQWRKRNIHLLVGANSLDTALLGDKVIRDLMKGFNGVGHRMDELSAHSGGITGDATRLPKNLPGAGYINGYDNRPGSEFATKYAPEKVRPGDGALTDIPRLAGIIAQTPLRYDPPVQGLLESWGIGHQHVFTQWYGRPKDGAAAFPATQPASAAQGTPFLAAVPEGTGAAYREDAEKVRAYLHANPGFHSYAQVVAGTRLSLGAVKACAHALHANGQAVHSNKQLQAA